MPVGVLFIRPSILHLHQYFSEYQSFWESRSGSHKAVSILAFSAYFHQEALFRLTVARRFHCVRNLKNDLFPYMSRNYLCQISKCDIRGLIGYIICLSAFTAEDNCQQAVNGIGHIGIGIILRPCGLEYDVLGCNSLADELADCLRIRKLYCRPIGTNETRDHNIQLLLRLVRLAEGFAASLALRIACPQSV